MAINVKDLLSKSGGGIATGIGDVTSRPENPLEASVVDIPMPGESAPTTNENIPVYIPAPAKISNLPPKEINDRAFYTASLDQQGDFKETFARTQFDLETFGTSDKYEEAIRSWGGEEQEQLRQAMVSIVQDPNLHNEQKMKALEQYNTLGTIRPSLRDKYIQTVAAKDNHVVVENKVSQDKIVEALNANLSRHEFVEYTKQQGIESFRGDWGGLAISVARDFLIPGAVSGATAVMANAVYDKLGVSSAEEARKTVKGFLLGGTTHREIGEILKNTIDPRTKRDLTLLMLEEMKNIPGGDYNKFDQAQNFLNQGDMSIFEEGWENFLTLLDATFVGAAVSRPLKFLHHITTLRIGDIERKIWSYLKTKSLGKKAEINLGERIDPASAKAAEDLNNELASNPPTGSATATSKAPVVEDEVLRMEIRPELANKTVPPDVPPLSTIGITKAANPTQARELASQAVIDPSIASATGVEPGNIIGGFVLPKIEDDFLKNNPDIVKDLDRLDQKFTQLFKDTELDPFLVNTTEREVDKKVIYETLQQTAGGHYQQANSSYRESLGKVEGVARYGRDADFGYNTATEAIELEKRIKDSFKSDTLHSYNTRVVEDNGGQWYVEMDWTKEYDPFSARQFGLKSADAKFMGMDIGGLSRSWIGKFLVPNTMRLDEWVTKGGFSTSITAAKTEEAFLKMQKQIRNTDNPRELQQIVNEISERGEFLSRGEIAEMFPWMTAKQKDQMMGKQALIKRYSDYLWNWTNRNARNQYEAEGFEGIYNKSGELLGYGSKVDTLPKGATHIYDFDLKTGVSPLTAEGKTIVKLKDTIIDGKNHYTYAVVDTSSGSKLGILPNTIVPKIAAYIPRINTENWYVKRTPKSVRINGESISDQNVLRKDHTRTVAAARTEADGDIMVERLKKQYPDDELTVVRERADTGDAIVTDYKVYKEMVDYGKTRGDRLPTIDGFSRLEDPFVAMSSRAQTVARLDAWKNYDEIFKKNFMKRFGNYLVDGEFPNIIHDLKLPLNATEDEVKAFKVAQRLFEQYTNQRYKLNLSDVVWKSVGHVLADTLDGFKLNGVADVTRDIANEGDLVRKGTRSLSNNLFINLNSIPQWIVQTQQNLEFALIEPGFRKDMKMLPALLLNVLSKASEAKVHAPALEKISRSISLSDKTEFDAIAKAIYDAGIPQSVDLNMMLHGGLDDLAKPLSKGLGVRALDMGAQVITTPGKIGKTIGYTPAQLLADMGGFLFAKARWQRLNPGQNWNTPSNIRQIAADGWDIMGSMSTRAGSMPYQDGYMGMLFQFQAILHKQFFQVFSSKSLKKAEGELIDPKVKLAAARAALYGAAGIPGAGFVMKMLDEHTDGAPQEVKNEFQKYKGGLADLITNSTIDLMFAEPGDIPSDLAVSDRIGPLPDTLPYVDLLWSMYKFATGQKVDSPRFPFIGATGAVYDAVTDINNLFKAREFDTIEGAQMIITEIAEMASFYNNYGKAAIIAEIGDKKDKFGQNLGLELSYKHAVAQLFGIVSHQELSQRIQKENMKERDEYLTQRTNDLYNGMLLLRDKIGKPEFAEYVRRAKVLAAGTNEADKEEIIRRFIAKDKENYKSKKDSLMLYLRDHYKEGYDKHIANMIATLSNGTPKDKALYERLQKERILP